MRLPIPNHNPNHKTHPNPNPIFNPNPFLKENKNDTGIYVNVELYLQVTGIY